MLYAVDIKALKEHTVLEVVLLKVLKKTITYKEILGNYFPKGTLFKREGTAIYLWLIHVDIWQKTTTFCKAIILQ